MEDAFLRSLFPARVKKDPPLGLLLDTRGVHFDPSRPNDLECLLAEHPLDDENQILQAKNAIERIKNVHLSKYLATDLTFSAPPSGYILVVDQLRVNCVASRVNLRRPLLHFSQSSRAVLSQVVSLRHRLFVLLVLADPVVRVHRKRLGRVDHHSRELRVVLHQSFINWRSTSLEVSTPRRYFPLV